METPRAGIPDQLIQNSCGSATARGDVWRGTNPGAARETQGARLDPRRQLATVNLGLALKGLLHSAAVHELF